MNDFNRNELNKSPPTSMKIWTKHQLYIRRKEVRRTICIRENQSLNPSIGFDWHSTETLFRFSSSTNSVWYSSSGLDPHYHHYALCDHHDRSTYPWKFFIDLSRMKCHEIDFLLKFRNWEKASWVESKFSMYSFEIEFHWEDVEVVDEHVRVVRRWMTRKRLVDDEYYVE